MSCMKHLSRRSCWAPGSVSWPAKELVLRDQGAAWEARILEWSEIRYCRGRGKSRLLGLSDDCCFVILCAVQFTLSDRPEFGSSILVDPSAEK